MLSSMLCQHWLAQQTKRGCLSQWIVGRLAQLEECFVCNEDAGGSNPPASTTLIIESEPSAIGGFLHPPQESEYSANIQYKEILRTLLLTVQLKPSV